MTVEQSSVLHKFKEIRRIREQDELVGKCISFIRDIGGGEILLIRFTDGSVVKLKAIYSYGEDLGIVIDPEISYWELEEVGLLSYEEYKLLEALKTSEDGKRRDEVERREWERLNKKFGGVQPQTGISGPEK